jgi:metallo-beta-lactamase family protein
MPTSITSAGSRTQELIYELDRINPGVPVFIDSPLGIQITRLYQDMDDC